MSIVHVNQIKSRLEATYTVKIDLTDVGSRPPEDLTPPCHTRLR
jgi:hypothetical protein